MRPLQRTPTHHQQTGRRRRSAAVAAVCAVVALVAAACTDGGNAEPTSTDTGPAGEMTLLSQGPVVAWDPQRMGNRQTVGFAARTWMRTLTTYAAASDVGGQRQVVGDLANSTGEANGDKTEWSFTLRQGISWQDGSDITCADVRYGVARAFDPDTNSSGYALAYLDIPKNPDGSSTYPGPYGSEGSSSEAEELIADAVECDGRNVTFHLSEPVSNFDEVVSLPEFAPYKESEDEQDDSAFAAFSSGPYQLEGEWTPSSGGTWVRNPEWSERTDAVRTPGPERIVHREGIEPDDALTAIAEGGSRTVMLDPLPTSLGDRLDGFGENVQSVAVDGQLVDYLAPNITSEAFEKQTVRRAFAVATDRQGYVERLGGSRAGYPTWSLLPAIVPSAHDTLLDSGPSGDPAAAQALLEDADIETPIPVRIAYRGGSDNLDEAMGVLEAGWEAAGFEVTLDPIEESYFEAIADRQSADERDAVWSNWGPDYPSAATILQPLFDDRINLTEESLGRDYGQVSSDDVNDAMDKANRTVIDKDRAAIWSQIDQDLLDGAFYVPLRQSRLTYVAGDEVTGLVGNAAYGGVPDFGLIGVSR